MERFLGRAREGEAGMTLIEVALVVAVVGVLLALAVPNMSAYQRRQDARHVAQRISDALNNARSLAIKEGNPYFVLFLPSGSLRIVDDDDWDYAVDSGELTTDFGAPAGTDPDVTFYNAVASPPAASRVVEDPSASSPIPSTGVTFPVDAATTWPAVGFTTQGFPVSLPPSGGSDPGDVGTGVGSYYVTDNDTVVYAATLLPLGGTRVRVFRPTIGDWY